MTNKIYVANQISSNVTVIDGTNNSTATVAAPFTPYAVEVNPATNKIYVADLDSNNMTVIDGTNNSTSTVAVGSFPNLFAVNPLTNQIYVANRTGNNVTVITPAPTNAIPLNTAITPLAGMTTSSYAPTFTMTATSTYSPTAPPPQNIYYQVDTANGTWSRATNTGSTSTTVTATAQTGVLQNGLHTIYFFASDGSDGTSINPNRPAESGYRSIWGRMGFTKTFEALAPESSPVIGGINSYIFRVIASPTAAGVTVAGRVTTANGIGVRNAVVQLTDSLGATRRAVTSAFGYYRFDDVEVGGTYTVAVASKRFTFIPRIISLNDAIEDLDFAAQ